MNKEELFSEGLLLALLTVASYLVAYNYEVGFCNFWELPKYLIEISLVSALAAGVSLYSLLCLVLLIMNLPITLLDRELNRENDLRRRFVISHLIIFAVLVALVLGSGLSATVYVLVVVILIFDAIYFLIPWYSDKKKHPGKCEFFERINRSIQCENEPNNAFGRVRTILGKQIYMVLLIAIPTVSLLANAAGVRAAKKESLFTVIESENLIILRRYGDTYVLRSIDIKNEVVGNKLMLWSLSELATKVLSTRDFKNLTVVNSE